MTPSTRHSDPETSHLAERSVTNVRYKQSLVWAVLDEFGPLTDEELLEIYDQAVGLSGVDPQSPSGLRTRRAELVELGHVEWTGKRIRSSTNNRLRRVWRAV